MSALPHPDQFRLQAAIGWLELGNHFESTQELENISPKFQNHPDVLKVRWHISMKAGQWSILREISTKLVSVSPADPDAWRIHANSFHYAGDFKAAYRIVKPKLAQFGND